MRLIPFLLPLLVLLWSPAQAQGLRVLTDVAPVHGLVSQVAEGVLTPALLLEADADPHHIALRPSQASAVLQADLVIWIGPALTPWLVAPLGARDGPILALAPDLVEGRDDPHLWLDPARAADWLAPIAQALSEADPANAHRYQDNAARARLSLATLRDDVAGLLETARGAQLITAHDAWRHFAGAFDLAIADTIQASDHSRPGARHLAALSARVAGGEIACVLSEGPETEALARTIIGTSRTPLATVYPLGWTIPQGPEFYASHLTATAREIAACVSRG